MDTDNNYDRRRTFLDGHSDLWAWSRQIFVFHSQPIDVLPQGGETRDNGNSFVRGRYGRRGATASDERQRF